MSARRAVTVIGLGPMGRAMAAALLGAGHPVTVWNRTAARADGLVAAGATLAATPADAIAASELAILSLTDYHAMYEILGDAVEALAGATLVNLSSDTPNASRAAAAWAAEHRAQFLTGGLMVPAPMVGTDDAYAYYSGPGETFERAEPVLGVIGAPRFVGDDPGLAQLMYQAQLTVFLTGLSSLLQATALVTAAGVPAERFIPDALDTLSGIPAMLAGGAEVATALATGTHPGDLSSVTMMGATADHIVQSSRTLGIDLALPLAVKSQYDRAIAAGHGKDNWTSLYEVIKPASL